MTPAPPNLLDLCNLVRVGELDGLLISSMEIVPADDRAAVTDGVVRRLLGPIRVNRLGVLR
jgi:hypothetical protein